MLLLLLSLLLLLLFHHSFLLSLLKLSSVAHGELRDKQHPLVPHSRGWLLIPASHRSPALLHPSASTRRTRGCPHAHSALRVTKKLHTWSLRFFQRRLSDRNPHSCWVRRSRVQWYILLQGAWIGSALLGGWRRCSIFLSLCWSGKSFCSDEYSFGQKTYEKQRKKEKNPTVCIHLHSQIKNIIEMTISSIWKKSPFNRTKREKRREVGTSHHSTPELWVQTYFTHHLSKSFGSCLYFTDDGQWRHLANSSTNWFSF